MRQPWERLLGCACMLGRHARRVPAPFCVPSPHQAMPCYAGPPRHPQSRPLPPAPPRQVFLLSLLDLPFSISPVVTGLMLTLLYGRTGWFAALLQATGISVVFAFTGGCRTHTLATALSTLPLRLKSAVGWSTSVE